MRIVSWNVRKAVGLDWRRDPDRVLHVLEELRPDIVLLQEADKRLGRRPAALPPAKVERAGFHVVDAAPGPSLGWHGNAILSRGMLRPKTLRTLDLPGLEPRGAIFVEVGDIWLCGTHLGLRRRDRKAQIRMLMDASPERCVIGGDLNEWSRDPAVLGIGDPWRMVIPGPSFHAARPRLPLDRFISRGVRLTGARVVPPASALGASDHLPVIAEISQE
ncbi:endonuclease/exonuclease/phosphatase family protein [Jannaschia aquimarina]|uniref:Endonuclease/Exonuclease/phosphatase family protein n=1 Tax=Jannaschia aquimarina TaxID=935700 RepID=A0A0D1EGY9_9RHOB|nr:endonuclease/exonuclease/phosphatase family protein [Jannaschia aquimarina]KIT15115.1 Endonuclease/Exonuclease/phosphatase family protein [Jannaschia aquimarina]SNS64475.1 Metal-dependent hydrolase, endonuclease/exonuclease/phosphatase family [Jannaschia aquimarina]